MALFKVKAVPDFTQLRNELTKLSSTPVKIKVDATEFQALSNQAIKTMNATARLTKAQNELAVAQEKTKQTANELAAAQQKTAQSANQLATQMEKTATAEEKVRKANLDLSREIQKATTEQEKQKTVAAQTALQQEKTATSAANLAVQQEKTATTAAKAAGSIKEVGQEAKNTSAFADLMGDSFSRVFARMAVWQVLGDVISKTVSAFKDAIATMKDVDTEMVNVQKVTDYSKAQMEALEENAYSLASAYGRAADEITTMYTTFARAGYIGDQLDSMTELGTLLSNIGDVSGDTAAKFLLAVDAAWKLNGSEEALMTVMDGLNEITDKNATDMEALTSGITVAGSVFAEAGESVQTFASLVGAGVAATQRSGSEISRALRTIVMNIRQIRGETEDGELIDGESIANASKALKEYAGINTMVNGQLRLSSDVLKDLAAKWNDLDTVAQSAISEALAGKRQANVLSSLMGNWDTVEKMMTDYADGVGSALRENEIYMDSWEAKSKKLSAAWTEFVSHLIETDTIKGALDGLIGLVELLDTDTGRFIITVAALTAGVGALGQGLKWLGGTELIKNGKTLAECFVEAASGAGSFSSVLGLMNPKLLIAVAAVAALYGAYKLLSGYIEEANRSLASYDDEIDGVNSQLENNKKRIEEINNLPWEQRTSAILDEKKALEEENKELERQIELLNKEKLERARNVVKESVGTGEMTTVSHGGTTSRRSSSTFEKTVAGAEAYSYLTEQLNEYSDALDRNGEISDDVRAKYEENVAASARMVEALKTMQAAGDDLTDEQLALIAAYDNFVSASDNAQNAIKNHVSALIDEQAQTGATGQALYDLVAAQIATSNTGLNFTQQMAALQELALQAGYTMDAINAVFAASGNVAKWQLDRWDEQTVKGLMQTKGMSRADAEAEVIRRKWGTLTTNYTPSTSTKSPSYSPSSTTTGNRGSTSSATTGNAAARKNAQAAIKQLQKERDAELDAIQEQIDALQKQADIEDQQAKIEEYKLEILKKQDALMNARNERTVRQYNAATGQWEWVADAAKVKKAEEELEDAKKDLRDYESKVELDLAVDELKARQEAIKAAYQIKIDAWNDYLSGLSNAIASESQYLRQSVDNNKSAVDRILAERDRLNNNDSNDKPGVESPGGKDDTIYAPSTSSEKEIRTMQAYLGVTVDGKWGTQSTKALKNSRFSSFDAMLRHFFADDGALDKAVAKVKSDTTAKSIYNEAMKNGYSKQEAYAVVARSYKYDEGGILQGMGGIKATPRDEIVLPPKLAAKMLKPQASQVFKARVSELGYMYGSETGLPRTMAGSSDNRSYTDNSGTRYQIGSIVLTEQQARQTTLYDVAQQAHSLQAFSG